MAKSLGIRVPAGFDNPDNVDFEVLQPITPAGSLGSIVASILAASANAVLIAVSVDQRKVLAAEMDGMGNLAALDAAATTAGANRLARFALEDDTKRSGPWNNTNGHVATLAVNNQTAIEQVVTHPAKKTFSVSSLISALEDEAAKGDEGAFPVPDGFADRIIVVNQRDKHVSVYQMADVVGPGEFEAITGVPPTIEYEQIPAEEAAAEAAQWGE